MSEAITSQGYGFDRILSTVGSFIPVLTIAAVTTSIGYTIVYLHFSGAVSITPITIADVFAKAWVIIPAGVLFAFLNILAMLIGYKIGYSKAQASQTNAPPKRMSKFEIAIASVGVLVSFAALAVPAVLRDNTSDNLLVLKVLVGGMLIFTSATSMITLSRVTAVHPQFVFPIIAYIIAMLIYSVAAMGGTLSLLEDGNALVRYGDRHVFCGKLITLVERGVVVYEPTFGVRKMIPASSIKSLEMPVACAVAERPKKVPSSVATEKGQ
jgi:hypothetical protein